MPADWEVKAEKCRKILKESMKPEWLLPESALPPSDQLSVIDIPESCGLLTEKEISITNSTATELVSKMGTGSLTAVETVTAFLKRAHVGQQLLNFATEFMVDESLARAKELDAQFKATGKLSGPLHGVPMSVKEHIGLKGKISHATYVAWIDNIPDESALLVRLLEKAGAVFIVRTNQPQSLMHLDCSNPITGTTVNPHNRKLTPGGSSGGEGASLGFRCAALGIGTDIGGSIRAPAAFSGAYGLRTTALRNPYKGVFLAGDGQESIRCVIGPLANSVADLNLFQKAVIDQEPWEEETSLVPLPWKEVSPYKPEQTTIGVIWDDGIVKPHPPIMRGLKHAVARLKAAGVNVVDWEPYDHQKGWEIVAALYFPDAAACQKDLLAKGGEPVSDLTKWAFQYGGAEPMTVTENWEWNVKREAYRAEYHRLMKERGVDFILCPTYVGVAAELATAQYWNYTAIWNILDQPAVVFQTGLKADPALDPAETDYKPRSDVEEREFRKYVPEKFVGAPIALQLVGKHYRDEETVAAAELVTNIIKPWTA